MFTRRGVLAGLVALVGGSVVRAPADSVVVNGRTVIAVEWHTVGGVGVYARFADDPTKWEMVWPRSAALLALRSHAPTSQAPGVGA